MYHIGKSPFTARGETSIGYWKEGSVKGVHKDYKVEVSHDPITIGKMVLCDSSAVINAIIMAMISRYVACRTGALNSVQL